MPSSFDRRSFLNLSASSLIAGVVSSPQHAQEAAGLEEKTQAVAAQAALSRRQNLILFMPDEMRADSLSCYGNPVARTPNFDNLARDGTRFANCHVQYPVCGASRCAMLTGWPTSVRGHRSLYYFLRPEEPNLFRYLKQSGYDVFWFGKNDALAAQSFAGSVTRWADSTVATTPAHELTPGSKSMLYSAAGDRRQTGDYQMLQMAIKVLDRRETDKPFCIFLPLIEPHPPYTIPKDFYDMYSPANLPPLIPPGLKAKPDFHEGIRSTYGLDKLSDITFRQIRAVYYGKVSYSDWLLGELCEAMVRSGREKDTALFVTSDHGDYAGDYGLVEKWPSGLEDCLTHVPMIGKVPGGKASVVAEDMVEMYDIMQTMLDLAGVKANHTHFSRSLLTQMSGGAGDSHRAAFAEGGYNVYEPQCFEPPGVGGGPYIGKVKLQNEQPVMVSRSAMIRTRTHKLIYRPQGQSELYKSAEDPGETQNLFGHDAVSAVHTELQLRLLTHFVNTSGVAPKDKDQRNQPPYYPTRSDLPPDHWQQSILDR